MLNSYTDFFSARVKEMMHDDSFVSRVHSSIYLTIDPSHNEFYNHTIDEMIIVINSVINGSLQHITGRNVGLCSNIHRFVSRSNRRISMSIMAALGELFVSKYDSNADVNSYLPNNPIPYMDSREDLWIGDGLEYRIQYCKWIIHHLQILKKYPLQLLKDVITSAFNQTIDLTTPQKITTVFCYNGFLCIDSDYSAKGILNQPDAPGEIGFVIDANQILFTQEAIDILKNVHHTSSNLGDVDCYSINHTGNIIFSWIGGPKRFFDMYDVNFKSARTANFNLLKPSKNVKIEPIFLQYIDNMLEQMENQ